MEFPIFNNYKIDLMACSTSRQGGVGSGAYGSFSVCDYTGDSDAAVEQNRLLFCKQHGVNPSRFLLPHQTHGSSVALIDGAFLKLPEGERQIQLDGVDAMITAEREVCLGIQTADCVPVLMYDVRHHAIGVAHCGWRGTAARLAAKCALEMNGSFGTRMADLYVALGPSISVENYEVGEELMDPFQKAEFPLGLIFKRHPHNLRFHLDLPLANVWLLRQIGVPAEQIQPCGVCSYAHSDSYFSARKLGVHSGRTLSCAMLR